MGIKKFINDSIEKADRYFETKEGRIIRKMHEGFEGKCDYCNAHTRVWNHYASKACKECINKLDDKKRNERMKVEEMQRITQRGEMAKLQKKWELTDKERLLKKEKGTRKGFSDSIKRQVLRQQDNLCANCRKFSQTWDFDHKDGDRSNNDINNCQALCPNCHSYKSRKTPN